MRIAIVSDIHGNLNALEAVLADLRESSPDLIFHGGDLADGGANPAEVVDRIRQLGWPGVAGNADEMLWRPQSLRDFADQLPKLGALFAAVADVAAATREALGEERLAWLRDLPHLQFHGSMALVHAGPGDLWRAPVPETSDDELESIYRPLGHPIAVYGHIHRSYIRKISGKTVANTGSISLSYDGDRRAAYLVLDGSEAAIRRVQYDVEKEIKALFKLRIPHAGWIAKMLESGRPQMP